jgi:hypothetical protein
MIRESTNGFTGESMALVVCRTFRADSHQHTCRQSMTSDETRVPAHVYSADRNRALSLAKRSKNQHNTICMRVLLLGNTFTYPGEISDLLLSHSEVCVEYSVVELHIKSLTQQLHLLF